MTKILTATSKGQVTLPVIWRKKFNTNQFLARFNKNKLIIEPISIVDKKSKALTLKEVIEKERKKSDLVVFDAYRDNNGEGIEAGKLIKILEKING